MIWRAEGTAIAGSVDTAQSSACCSGEGLAVSSVAIDCVRDCGYCWRLASVARMVLSFLWPARYNTTAVVVPLVGRRRKRQLPITTAARRLLVHKTRLWIWVVLNVAIAGGTLLVLPASQWVPRLLLFAAAPVLVSALEVGQALHPRCEGTAL